MALDFLQHKITYLPKWYILGKAYSEPPSTPTEQPVCLSSPHQNTWLHHATPGPLVPRHRGAVGNEGATSSLLGKEQNRLWGQRKLSGKEMQVLAVGIWPACTKEIKNGGEGHACTRSAACPRSAAPLICITHGFPSSLCLSFLSDGELTTQQPTTQQHIILVGNSSCQEVIS